MIVHPVTHRIIDQHRGPGTVFGLDVKIELTHPDFDLDDDVLLKIIMDRCRDSIVYLRKQIVKGS